MEGSQTITHILVLEGGGKKKKPQTRKNPNKPEKGWVFYVFWFGLFGCVVFWFGFFTSTRLARMRKGAGWDARAELPLPRTGQEGQLGTVPKGKVKLSQGTVSSQEAF